jgi:hypothetical protein
MPLYDLGYGWQENGRAFLRRAGGVSQNRPRAIRIAVHIRMLARGLLDVAK